MKRGFTLIELLVVMAMIAVIAAAFVSSVNAARRRAYIGRATVEVKEMTNAILAYEQYAPGRTLESVASGAWKQCGEGDMSMILGGAQSESGDRVPVLFNGHVRTGYLRDPWNTPYRYRIEKTDKLTGGGGEETKSISYSTAAALPNFFRLSDAERK